MKIVIVGGGIAGLSTYVQLRKHLPQRLAHAITVYESHKPRPAALSDSPDHLNQSVNLEALSESTAVVGGGFGVSPNGMRVLRDLSLELHDRVVTQGFAAKNFIFKGANGWTLGMHSTSDKAVRGEDNTEEVCIASSRHGLWHTLRQYVTEKYGTDVIKHGKVIKVARVESRVKSKVRVDLVDERGHRVTEYADLVIGADGVKSVVRKALFGDDKKYAPMYSGQSGVGGFHKTSIPPNVADNNAMVFTFGGNGFFGYSSGAPTSDNQLMWWSTFETLALPDTRDVDPRTIKDALFQRHKHWRDPVVQETIKNAEVELIYPTWIMPELPHWGKQGIVLIGDAAHAMDPTTGQGASQALEDSQTLALLLAVLLDAGRDQTASETRSIDQAAELFYEIRFPRVNKIVERGRKLAGKKENVGVVAEYTMYCFLWLIMRLPFLRKIMVGDTNRELYCWSAEQEIKKALKESRTRSPAGAMASETLPLLKKNIDWYSSKERLVILDVVLQSTPLPWNLVEGISIFGDSEQPTHQLPIAPHPSTSMSKPPFPSSYHLQRRSEMTANDRITAYLQGKHEELMAKRTALRARIKEARTKNSSIKNECKEKKAKIRELKDKLKQLKNENKRLKEGQQYGGESGQT